MKLRYNKEKNNAFSSVQIDFFIKRSIYCRYVETILKECNRKFK